MTPDEVVRHVSHRLSLPTSGITVERLTGGYVNHVFRVVFGAACGVRAGTPSVIVKHAPAYVAALPSVALSPRRLEMEARCLRELGPEGQLFDVVSELVRAPCMIDFDVHAHVLIMEDLGVLPDLAQYALQGGDLDAHGLQLGAFVGRLHARSRALPQLLRELDNRDVQEVRQRTQYQQVEQWLGDAGIADAAVAGARARELGQRFLLPGHCLVMGDLWPRSILIDERVLRVIDWELAHAGDPAQDLGHIAAHLWMQAQRAPTTARAHAIDALHGKIWQGYGAALAALQAADLLTHQVLRAADMHAACEVFARVLGPFRRGFLYDGLPPDDASVGCAIECATRVLVADESRKATVFFAAETGPQSA